MTIIIVSPSRMEPCLLDEANAEIVDLVAALAGATAPAIGGGFGRVGQGNELLLLKPD
jgi:hypothetical protein